MITIWSAHVLNMCLIMEIIFLEIKYNISEKNRESKMAFLIFNKSIKQIVCNERWSLILVKSNQYTVDDFDFEEINDMLCFIITS